MTTYKSILIGIKKVCDAKDEEIANLQEQVKLLLKERQSILKNLKEGNVDLVIEYLT